jgi:hypothetical protein
MPVLEAQKIRTATEFINKYYGRRVEVTCKDGDIFSGRLGWLDEGEEFGFSFHDVEMANGKKESEFIVPMSQIKSFVSLEEENTEEERKELFK